MKRFGALVLAALSFAAFAAPSSSASQWGPRALFMPGCRAQTASAVVTREQAQGLLPKGFKPTPGPAAFPDLAILFIATKSCGEENNPTLELFETYMQVEAPKKFAHQDGSNYFIVDAGLEGRLAKTLSKHLCASSLFDKAEIDSTITNNQWADYYVSDASAEVTSKDVSASIQVKGAGPDTAGSGMSRLFYSGGAKPRYFDLVGGAGFISLGPSVVTFSEPYLGLPEVNVYAGRVNVQDLIYYRPVGCKG